MNLDDISIFERIDQTGMLRNIRNLPDQLSLGWIKSQEINIQAGGFPENVIFIGFQDNLIIIEILQLLVSPYYSRPFHLLKEKTLPKWWQANNLVILKITESNFEEMQILIEQSLAYQTRMIALVSKNEIKNRLANFPITLIQLSETSFSRNSIGYDVMFLSGILHQVGLIPDLTEEISDSLKNLEEAKKHLDLQINSSQNPAKRLAGQMVGRWVKIVSGGNILSLAKYWNQQINKSAKSFAIYEDIGDLVNYSINGIVNPGAIVQHSMVVFLKSDFIEEKIGKLIDITKEELMCYGIGTDFYQTYGSTLFSQIWNTVMFGDYLAYYLAIAYECDPEPTIKIET